MELTQLRYFCVTARQEHMTCAAAELHITQPALSKVIARLESNLNTRLFDRDGRNIRLNKSGRIVYEHCERVFGELDNMRARLSDLSCGRAGDITVASSFPDREPNWIHASIREFMMARPNISMSFRQQNTDRMLPALQAREIDIAISSTAIRDDDIEWVELFHEKMGVILSADHPLAKKEALFLSDLRGQRFLCHNASSDIQDLTYTFCRQAGFEPSIYFEGSFPSFIGESVSRGVGVSLISKGGFRSNEGSPMRQAWEDNIIFRELSDDGCRRVCGLATLKSRYLTKAAKDFYSHLTVHAQAWSD